MNKFLKLAATLAQNYEYDSYLEYKLCAILVRGGKILSIGYNNRGSAPIQKRFAVTKYGESTHAEVDAILNGRKLTRLEGSKVYVVRVRSDNTVGMAKPCEMCQRILKNYGVKRAVYTVRENEVGILSL